MFKLAKCKVDLPPRSKTNSHRHDWVNFSHLKMVNAMTPINQSSTMDVGETNDFDLVMTHNGVKVFDCLCRDNIWQFERCPPRLNNCCLALQKNSKHYYKAKIISKQINRGILASCYVGY